MALLALGPHIFSVLPVNLQKLTRETKSNWAAIPRFGQAVARQFTGHGEHSIKLDGLVFDAHFGGFAAYEAVRATQLAARPVPLIGLAAGLVGTLFGRFVILAVSDAQDYLDPLTGIGRRLSFDIEVAPLGEDGPAGGLFG